MKPLVFVSCMILSTNIRCAGIRMRMLYAVHHSFPAVEWYWVLGVHKPLSQGPEGTESNLDG